MLDAFEIRPNVALNGPASELTVQAIQREILQKDQRCNDGQAVDRDRPQVSDRPNRVLSGVERLPKVNTPKERSTTTGMERLYPS